MKRILVRASWAVLWVAGFCAIPALAEVTRSEDNGFEAKGSIEISKPSGRVFSALTREIAHWWDAAHTYSGDSARLSLEAEVGGCFCERLVEGGGVRHLEVVYVEPGKQIRLTGGLGPLQELAVAGVMNWKLTDIDGGTRLDWSYAVGGFRPGGLMDWAAPVDGVVSGQMQRLERYLEVGSPSVD